MAGVVGRFRSAAGVPLVGHVRLTPVGGAVSAGGESVAGVLRIPLGGDGWCRKVGLVASPGTQWRVEPLVTLEGITVTADGVTGSIATTDTAYRGRYVHVVKNHSITAAGAFALAAASITP